jgi:hypothetical protein
VPEEVSELQKARDDVWSALGSAPLRRALLGRERCDKLTRIAHDVLSQDGVCSGAAMHAGYRAQAEGITRDLYPEKCSGFFTTLVLSWAISAIVQALINRWLNNLGRKS